MYINKFESEIYYTRRDNIDVKINNITCSMILDRENMYGIETSLTVNVIRGSRHYVRLLVEEACSSKE